jgi:putative Holliday junction resolvase
LGLTAQGLSTIIRKNKGHDLKILESLIKNYKVEKIIIGFPVRIDGSEGIQCKKVNKFVSLLDTIFSLPVVKWPETLSTKEAEEILIKSGIRWKKRKDKIDKLAACLILQGYLDSVTK